MNESSDEKYIDNEHDIYIFMCLNVRDKAKACGNSSDSNEIYEYFRRSINRKRPEFKVGRIVKLNKSGCLSRCADGPNIVIFPDNIWYTYKTISDIDEIIDSHIIKGIKVKRLLISRTS